MTREEFKGLLELVTIVVGEPSERIAFTSAALNKILSQIWREYDAFDGEHEVLLAAWHDRADLFRDTLIKLGNRRPRLSWMRMATVISERDVNLAANQCAKGPDYPYPERRVVSGA
jgi:hypothetical protein